MKCLIFIVFLLSSYSVYAKQDCTREYNNLKSHQKVMRNGGSSSRMAQLAKEEHVIASEYQDCRSGKNKASKNKNTIKKQVKSNNRPATKRQLSFSKQKPIKYTRPISFSGRFKGEKQVAWVEFYETPNECLKPKSTQAFAKCMAHRDEQAFIFDKRWRNNNAPPSIKIN
ncbi:hypothetical protein Q4489_07410 [Thalassotalea sp. 1_MG-2023]|uniref:hypothetical protein n=1 Tax=Thalassotalea sp. 1_MG-2023 TaxID=3062680 RepID=UPI0026E483C7|nr:hypothetical protein [Thalassotalea sp. 1_MG-2023]MDO6426834.1 hypothetical protein [Thalassotalea sp. 1_MG-2023]